MLDEMQRALVGKILLYRYGLVEVNYYLILELELTIQRPDVITLECLAEDNRKARFYDMNLATLQRLISTKKAEEYLDYYEIL